MPTFGVRLIGSLPSSRCLLRIGKIIFEFRRLLWCLQFRGRLIGSPNSLLSSEGSAEAVWSLQNREVEFLLSCSCSCRVRVLLVFGSYGHLGQVRSQAGGCSV